jgi:hypothetical protein
MITTKKLNGYSSMHSEAWTKLNLSSGNTESERYLVGLAKKAFLSLWSYPNVYTDEGRQGNGDGKELCDLLVVFGNDVILFSDKACKFSEHNDINIAWNRWYRRAIVKSAKQLSGAESWINRFPDRIFLDPKCESPLPFKFPQAPERRVHLVAVTRGSCEMAEAYWGGGSSGSLFIDTKLKGSDHENNPFRVGWVLPNKRLVHVLDEMTLDIALNELDTIADFITYLIKKEEQFTIPGAEFLIPGEEELVAFYLKNYDFKRQEHYFPATPEGALVVLREGDWDRLIKSPDYHERSKANKVSYLWDELIEFQNAHILTGRASSLIGDSSPATHERVMRMMAEENRLSRRALGESIYRADKVVEIGKRFIRTIVSSSYEGRVYIFLSLPRPADIEHKQYLEVRRGDLLLHAYKCKLTFEKISEVVGIAFEPGQEFLTSVDYFLFSFGEAPIDEVLASEIQQRLTDAGMGGFEDKQGLIIRNVPFPRRTSLMQRLYFWLKAVLVR